MARFRRSDRTVYEPNRLRNRLQTVYVVYSWFPRKARTKKNNAHTRQCLFATNRRRFSAVLSNRLQRLLSTIHPAQENIRSTLALLVIIMRYFLANNTRVGNLCSFISHHFKGLLGLPSRSMGIRSSWRYRCSSRSWEFGVAIMSGPKKSE